MRLFERIMADLQQDEYFKKFKFHKGRSVLSRKDAGREEIIKLEHHSDIYPVYQIQIYPVYGVKFNILHKWFNKFEVRQSRWCRWDESVYYKSDSSNVDVNFGNYFTFNENKTGYETEYLRFRNELFSCSNFFFPRFKTLEDLYKFRVIPMLEDTKQPGFQEYYFQPEAYCNSRFRITGTTEWVFETLALCLIVAPENYSRLKEILLEHIELMQKCHEPNMERYYHRLDEIFDYLEHYDFSKELAKMNKQ
ncbi:MAG: hypothetical protein J1E63_07870 [Muribaculaceae bacterium]|nr:hypothetical protein [Muribaculaceae bacterium]